MPFVMAGDPDLQSTADVLLSLQAHGADVVELGIPYSDPLADGPVIQAAAHRALEQKTTPAKVLEMLPRIARQAHHACGALYLQQSFAQSRPGTFLC